MNHSSTSSSEPRPRVWLAGFLVIVAAELILRVPGIPTGLPYYQPGVRDRVEALEAVDEPIDVLFVGSSVVRTNISPLRFDESAAGMGVAVTTFNGGLSSMHLVPNQIYVERFWLEQTQPLLVVHATALQEVLADPAEMLDRLQTSIVESKWFEDSWISRVESTVLERSALIRSAGTATQLLTDPASFRGNLAGYDIDERGYDERFDLLAEAVDAKTFDQIAGGDVAQSGYGMPDAATFARAEAAIVATARAVQASGATYVLVNMPEHPAKYQGAEGGRIYAAFIGFLQRLAEEGGFEFIDLTDGNSAAFADDSLFSDYHHMTSAGATATTDLLAARLQERGLLDPFTR